MKKIIKICMLILVITTIYNLLPDVTTNGDKPKELKTIPKTIKKQIKEHSTDIDLVTQDFKNINKNAKITVNKEGNKLIVQITQDKNINDLKANYVNITQYTDWACKNIRNDIKILDISVLLPDSKIRVVLSMNKMIDNDYFHENYVKECIKND